LVIQEHKVLREHKERLKELKGQQEPKVDKVLRELKAQIQELKVFKVQ
jgi:hypothetical protein